MTWYLMPQVRVGATGSQDFGTAALIYGGGLSSNAQFPINESSNISIINMISYYKTDALQVGDFDSGYDLQTTFNDNGLVYCVSFPKINGCGGINNNAESKLVTK